MDIDFKTIEIAIALQKFNSISKASQSLYVSEPALSKQLKKIEENLGFPLVKRSSSGVSLTEAGMLLAEKGAKLLEEKEALLDEMNELMNPGSSRKSLRIGLASCYAETFLPPVMSEFVRVHPEYNAEVILGKTHDLETMCINKEIDLVFTQVEGLQSQLTSVPLLPEETVLYVPASYQNDPNLADDIKKGSMKLSKLKNYPHGEVQGRAKYNQFTKAICAELPESSPSIIQSDNWSIVLNLIKKGLCFAVMPDIFDVDPKDAIKLHIETEQPVFRTIVLAHPKNVHLTDNCKAFIKAAKSVLSN